MVIFNEELGMRDEELMVENQGVVYRSEQSYSKGGIE